jgi:hypothetical protein
MKRMWKKEVVANFKVGICLEELSKTAKYLTQDEVCPDQNSNRTSPVHNQTYSLIKFALASPY